jgi:hypothetical protein
MAPERFGRRRRRRASWGGEAARAQLHRVITGMRCEAIHIGPFKARPLSQASALALNRSETMRIMFLAAAIVLSLGVGAASADNKGSANTNEGNADTRYTRIILEVVPTSVPEITPAPATPVVPAVSRTKGWHQDGQLILLY